MAGYVIHIAIAQEYLKKNNIKDQNNEFINGVIAPDLTKIKSETHYGEKPPKTNLKKFLMSNNIDTSYQKGFFLHLITDYLFYNKYLEYYTKEQLHHEYDLLNDYIIEKYKIRIPQQVQNQIFSEQGTPQILTKQLVDKFIEEISSINLQQVKKEVQEQPEKWLEFKN